MKKSFFMKTAVLLTVLFLVAAFLPLNALRYASGDEFAGHVDKEETVYAVLAADGSISSLVAVSLLSEGAIVSPGRFEDHAVLEGGSVTVLTPDVDDDVQDGLIVFTTDPAVSGLYYRGVPVARELPFTFDISYTLNGTDVEPSELAGFSGDVEILVAVRSNPDAGQYFSENFVCQVQVPLSLDVFSSVSAPGGQKMIAGSTATYSFTVLPGSDKDIRISAVAELFELQPLTIACVPFDISGFLGEGADFNADDLSKLVDASSELAQGAAELSGGLADMKSAIGQMKDSSGALVAGNDQLLTGFNGYLNGVTEMTGAFLEFSDGLTLTASQGFAMHQGFVSLNTQLSSLLDILLPLTASLPELEQMQIQGMAMAILDGLADFETALGQYTEAVQTLSEGAEQIGTGMGSSLAGAGALLDGIGQTGDGLRSFAGGLNELYSGSVGFAEGAAELAQGQSEFADGLSDSIGLFDSFIQKPYEGKPVSFTNSNVTVNSVQFVISTESIRVVVPEPEPPEELPGRSFWQKFIDLFIGVFK